MSVIFGEAPCSCSVSFERVAFTRPKAVVAQINDRIRACDATRYRALNDRHDILITKVTRCRKEGGPSASLLSSIVPTCFSLQLDKLGNLSASSAEWFLVSLTAKPVKLTETKTKKGKAPRLS